MKGRGARSWDVGFKPRAPHKYGAKAITLHDPNGALVRFASRMEAAHVCRLWLRLLAGEIADLTLQPKFPIHVTGPNGPIHIGSYLADAKYSENGAVHIEDVKGTDTPLSKFKRKCVEAEYGVKIAIIRIASSRAITKSIDDWRFRVRVKTSRAA